MTMTNRERDVEADRSNGHDQCVWWEILPLADLVPANLGADVLYATEAEIGSPLAGANPVPKEHGNAIGTV